MKKKTNGNVVGMVINDCYLYCYKGEIHHSGGPLDLAPQVPGKKFNQSAPVCSQYWLLFLYIDGSQMTTINITFSIIFSELMIDFESYNFFKWNNRSLTQISLLQIRLVIEDEGSKIIKLLQIIV